MALVRACVSKSGEQLKITNKRVGRILIFK